jgi:outer membrane receptor protein involved in Fe transport
MDLHLGYTFESGIFSNDTLSVSARNLLNQYPPYVNGSTGFDNLPAGSPVNPMGRMLTVGLDVRL